MCPTHSCGHGRCCSKECITSFLTSSVCQLCLLVALKSSCRSGCAVVSGGVVPQLVLPAALLTVCVSVCVCVAHVGNRMGLPCCLTGWLLCVLRGRRWAVGWASCLTTKPVAMASCRPPQWPPFSCSTRAGEGGWLSNIEHVAQQHTAWVVVGEKGCTQDTAGECRWLSDTRCGWLWGKKGSHSEQPAECNLLEDQQLLVSSGCSSQVGSSPQPASPGQDKPCEGCS